LWLWSALILCSYRPEAPAQLAITEVMSFASTNASGSDRPDFWELTNFGTNAVNLAGYRWFDSDNTFASRQSFDATNITPGESIILVRGRNSFVKTAADFRQWWGPNLPADLQIYFGDRHPGFDDADGDAVRVWDPNSFLIDEVRFAKAERGVTFTYDTNTGAFSELSQEGVAGAFRAAMGGDIGSPGYGTNKGPVALHFTQQPTNLIAAPGTDVILKAQATGRPGPQYQWYFNGVPVQVASASTFTVPRLVCFVGCGPSWRRAPDPNDLSLTNIQPGQSGSYFVEIFNGLERLTSAVVTVTVNTNPSPVFVECPPQDSCVPCAGADSPANLVASPGQTAIFTVRNQGFPLPTFQWSHSADGITYTELPGQNSRDLVVPNLQDSDAGLYCVRMDNLLGAASASARLTVRASPWLEITEVMSQACLGLERDWWELTNTNAEPVNLCGYRWDDETFTIGGGPTITNGVSIQPGESVILIESQTAESFVHWWGASNLPPNLRFVTYAANGLGSSGDSIHLWDPNEITPTKFVATAVFTAALAGVTRWFDSFIALQTASRCGDPGYGTASIEGDCGAFRAEQGCEIGSPGWTRLTPPILTSVRREGSRAVLTWSAQPGSSNQVQFTERLATPLDATVWQDGGAFQFPSASCVAMDSTIGVETQRFYRVVRIAAANCPCLEE
jgi:hypothetical protein